LGNAFVQIARVIVDVHREHARSYRLPLEHHTLATPFWSFG